VSRWARNRQRYRIAALSDRVASAARVGLVSTVRGLCDHVDRVQFRRISSLLAHQSVDLFEYLVQFSARPGPRVLGNFATDALVGCELFTGHRSSSTAAEGRG